MDFCPGERKVDCCWVGSFLDGRDAFKSTWLKMGVIGCLDPDLAEKAILELVAHFSHPELKSAVLGAADTPVSEDLSLTYAPFIINHLHSMAVT